MKDTSFTDDDSSITFTLNQRNIYTNKVGSNHMDNYIKRGPRAKAKVECRHPQEEE